MLELETRPFTDRKSIIALFQQLKERDPQQPWPLLPILTILGPEGSGKRTLLRYMCFTLCYQPDGNPTQPYAFLDFSQPDTPSSILSILVALRNQLQQHGGGDITFPRFDLGALIALAAPSEEEFLSHPNDLDIPSLIGKATAYLDLINGVSSSLGDLLPVLKPVVAGLKLAQEIPAVQNFFIRLERGKALHWYQTESGDSILQTSTDIGGVLLRLQKLSMLGSPTRAEILIENLLPKALIADLCECMQNSKASAIMFLDSFEVLLTPAGAGTRLLDMFTRHRKSDQTDPLLFVIGSQKPLPGITSDVSEEGKTPQEAAQERLAAWQRQLPTDKSFLSPADLCLLLELPCFRLEDTRSYLEQRGLQAVDVDTIHKLTNGYPHYVALVADAILEAEARQQEIPSEINNLTAQGRPLPEVMLSLITERLSPSERTELIFCAVPRTVDVATLRVVLDLPNDMIAKDRWDYWLNNFTFVHLATDQQQLILSAPIRDVLLRQLPENDYNRTHQRLQAHFHACAEQGDVRAKIEETYHGLACGDPEPAIGYAIVAQQRNLALWKPLLQAITQAPTRTLPADVEQRADKALAEAKQSKDLRSSITAIVLDTCMLNSVSKDTQKMAHLQHFLGDAYSCLPSGDQQANLQQALEYYEAALAFFTPQHFPDDWAETQNDLGSVYCALLIGDRQANLEKAIAYYQNALTVRQRTTFPRGWVETQTDLAAAYWALPKGNRQANLEQAERYLLATLDVCTPEIFSKQWANAQYWLGNVYLDLPTATRRQDNLEKAIEYYNQALRVYSQAKDVGVDWAETYNKLAIAYSDLQYPDRQANLKQAIDHSKEALRVYTRADFPRGWASVQRNIGSIYCKLPEGNREANVKQALDSCENALQIYTREAFPEDWAEAQHNKGIAYWTLPTGDRQTNLKKAIKCHEYALTIYTQEAYPYLRAKALHRLGNAYRDLPDGDRQGNIQKALQYYDEALLCFTHTAFPYEFARIQADRGIAYWLLPNGDRRANLEQALQYYQAALEIYIPKHSPDEWAMVQHHLGNAYRDRLSGDRQVNLQQAMRCYEAALEVRKREAFPIDWAETEHHLGNAYRDWPSGDQQVNLQQAMRCYEAALEVRKREAFPIDWAETQRELGSAYQCWQEGDRGANIQKAIECYEGALEIYQSMRIDSETREIEKTLESLHQAAEGG